MTWPSSTHARKGTVAPSGFAEAKIAKQLVSHQQQHSDFKAAILASHVKRVEVTFKTQQIICPAAARLSGRGRTGKPCKAGRSDLQDAKKSFAQQQPGYLEEAVLASHVKRVEVTFKPQPIICPAAAKRLQIGHSGKPRKAGRNDLQAATKELRGSSAGSPKWPFCKAM